MVFDAHILCLLSRPLCKMRPCHKAMLRRPLVHPAALASQPAWDPPKDLNYHPMRAFLPFKRRKVHAHLAGARKAAFKENANVKCAPFFFSPLNACLCRPSLQTLLNCIYIDFRRYLGGVKINGVILNAINLLAYSLLKRENFVPRRFETRFGDLLISKALR